MSQGYQPTGHRDFWFFAAVLAIVSAGMAISDVLGEYTGSVSLPILLGVALGFPCRWLATKTDLRANETSEHYSGWRRCFNSPLFSFFMLCLLSAFCIFYPGLRSGHPEYAKAFIGGVWLSLAFQVLLLWYKKIRKSELTL